MRSGWLDLTTMRCVRVLPVEKISRPIPGTPANTTCVRFTAAEIWELKATTDAPTFNTKTEPFPHDLSMAFNCARTAAGSVFET
jgi:hypothetical protein